MSVSKVVDGWALCHPFARMALLRPLRSAVPAWSDILALRSVLGAFTPGAWVATFLAGFGALVLIGGTTAIFQNDLFQRMTPVRPQDYVIWLITGLLVGLIAGTFVLSSAGEQAGKAVAGGFFADVAVGCPVCNKVVVAVIGSSGALTFFGPLQIFIGIGSLALLAVALLLRARTLTGVCPLPLAAAS